MAASPSMSCCRLPFFSPQCAQVTVPPLVNRITVFQNGMPQAPMVSLKWVKPYSAGVWNSGHAAAKQNVDWVALSAFRYYSSSLPFCFSIGFVR